MTWAQFRDSDHQVTDLFAIDAIPHYFTIDTDSVLQTEQLGGGSKIDGKLKKMVAEAEKRQQQQPAFPANVRHPEPIAAQEPSRLHKSRGPGSLNHRVQQSQPVIDVPHPPCRTNAAEGPPSDSVPSSPSSMRSINPFVMV